MDKKRKRQIAHIWIKNELKDFNGIFSFLPGSTIYLRLKIRQIAKAVKLSHKETLGIAGNIASKFTQERLA